MVHIIMNPERNRAIEALQQKEYERRNPTQKPNDKVYAEMQGAVNAMINNDSKMRDQLKVKPR